MHWFTTGSLSHFGPSGNEQVSFEVGEVILGVDYAWQNGFCAVLRYGLRGVHWLHKWEFSIPHKGKRLIE